jgi:hypothetical protein
MDEVDVLVLEEVRFSQWKSREGVSIDIVDTGDKLSPSAKDASCNFATGVDAPCGDSIYYAGDYYL